MATDEEIAQSDRDTGSNMHAVVVRRVAERARIDRFPREEDIPGRIRHVLYRNVNFCDGYGGTVERLVTSELEDAQVVSSEIGNGLHSPVLDIDVPAYLIPSSTPGHSHLYVDAPMTWRQYKRLLKALAAAGVIEKGYLKASLNRGHTDVRVPWLRKPNTAAPTPYPGVSSMTTTELVAHMDATGDD